MVAISKEIYLVKTDVDANNNKFWKGILFDDDSLQTFWGRVGYDGDSKTLASGGSRYLEKKAREKRNGGYKDVQIISNNCTTTSVVKESLAEIASKQITTNSDEVRKLIVRLANENVHNILSSTTLKYDENSGLFKTPLGIVSSDSILKARSLLTNISEFITKSDYESTEVKSYVSDYLMIIPQNVGMKLKIQYLFPDVEALRKQNDILDSLDASLKMVLSSPKTINENKIIEEAPKIFQVSLEKVTDGSILKRLDDKVRSTMQSMHNCHHLKLKNVYELEIHKMKEDFEKYGKPIGNVMELFHGSRMSNILSVLSVGMKMPSKSSSNVTGRMFSGYPGKEGLYFSDQSSKSLQYSFGTWAGQRNNNCFMFIVDVAMGKHYVPKGSHDGPFPHSGYDSTFAKGNQSGVMNNEMIIYEVYQCNLKYLLEFDV